MTTTPTAAAVIAALTWGELLDHDDPQRRRILRDERMHLQSAVRSADRIGVGAQLAEAIRVARMWGVDV
jgi:hypothetical protein